MREQLEVKLAENVRGIGAAGDRVTLALTPSDVHDPTELAEYLAGYRAVGMRADEASPILPVRNDEDKYRNFSLANTFQRVNVKGSTQGAVPEVDPKTELDSYKVQERYIGSFVPMQTQAQTGPTSYRPVMAASSRCMKALELDREIDVFTLLGTVANWNANQSTVAANAWTDVVNGTPITDVQNLVEVSDQQVNAIWMNQRIAYRFLRHPQVIDQMRQFFGDTAQTGIAQAVLNAASLGQQSDFMIPGLPPFKVVGSKVLNDTTGVLDFIMPDVAVGVTVPPGVPDDGEEIATTYTFRRRGDSGTGINVRQFNVEGRGPLGGTMVVVQVADIPKFTANNAGGIISAI